jgi:hypothetical protein
MWKIVSCALLAVACASSAREGEIGAIQAGRGIKVDGATRTVSIDESTVPLAFACASGGLIRRAGSGWECVGAAPDALQLGGRPASVYLTSDATAANSSHLGGWPASAYVTSGWGVANDSARLGGLTASSYVTSTSGVANDSARLGGHPSGDFVQTTLQTDIQAGSHRQVLSFVDPDGNTDRISADGLFCGTTAPTQGLVTATDPLTRGSVSGYRAAKLLCEQASGCASPTAHMCSASEMIRSAQLGIFANRPQGFSWVATGAVYPGSFSGLSASDCMGWTNGTSAQTASAWQSTRGTAAGLAFNCDQSAPLACCR